jgi:hypothetical protein
MSPTPFEIYFDLPSKAVVEWTMFVFPWSDFQRAPWADEGSMTKLDPTRITGLGFSFSGEENTIWLDEITLAGEEVPPTPAESAPDNSEQSVVPEGEIPEEDESGSLLPCPSALPLPMGTLVLVLVGKRKNTRS